MQFTGEVDAGLEQDYSTATASGVEGSLEGCSVVCFAIACSAELAWVVLNSRVVQDRFGGSAGGEEGGSTAEEGGTGDLTAIHEGIHGRSAPWRLICGGSTDTAQC
jgi:hypothetical protein